MKHFTLKLTGLTMALSLLAGCGEQANVPQEPGQELLPNPQHIEQVIRDNHLVDATVYAPEFPVSRTHSLQSMQFDPETALHTILPDDHSDFTTESGEFDRTVLTTGSGYSITASPGELYLSLTDLDRNNRYGEMENLMERYSGSHKEAASGDLDFMTMDQAVAAGCELLQDLGVSYTPKLQLSVGMRHDQIMAYQQELLERDKTLEFPEYDAFNNITMLNDLTQDDDGYYIVFGFTCDDLPIYGYSSEPNISYTDGVFPPYGTYARLLITRSGIQSLLLVGMTQPVQSANGQPLITAQEALDLYIAYHEEHMQPVPEDQWAVPAIYLEYIARHTDNGDVLTPYWCVVTKSKITNTLTDEQSWGYPSGMRLNAQTGGNYAYGY